MHLPRLPAPEAMKARPSPRRIDAVVNKKRLNLVRCLRISDQLIAIEVILLWHTIFECYRAVHGMANAIHNTSFNLIFGTARIDDYSAINSTPDLLNFWRIVLNYHIRYLCHIGVVTIICRYAPEHTWRLGCPVTFFL